MFVWPPMPLQPLDEGPERKLAHSDRLALPMMIAPAALSFFAMKASRGLLPASAQEPAVVGMPVVLTFTRRPYRAIRRGAQRAGRRASRPWVAIPPP